MKTIFHNFLSVLRLYKLAGILNICGLGVAFAAFLILMLKVSYELNYDKFHPDSDRIYELTFRIEMDPEYSQKILARGCVEAFKNSSPHVQACAVVMPAFGGDSYFTYEDGDKKEGFRVTVLQTEPDITEVFGFTMISGGKDCLKTPFGLLIPQSLADRYFNGDAIGKQLIAHDHFFGMIYDQNAFTVSGIYKDFPANSMLKNEVFLAVNPQFQLKDHVSANFFAFVKLDDPANAQTVSDTFVANYQEDSWLKPISAPLVLLSDLYLDNPRNRNTISLMILVAALIIIIAAINFTNFATSMAPVRMKSINTRKVMGAGNGELRTALVSEGVFTSLISFLLALLLVYSADVFHLLNAIAPGIHLSYGFWPLALTIVLALLTGLLAGIWPAMYITSFSPALVLKGSFGLSPKGRRLRTALICFQYFISVGLIISSLCMQMQNKYMLNYDLGFRHDRLSVVEFSGDQMDRYAFLSASLKSSPLIEDVGCASAKIGVGDDFRSEGCMYNNQEFHFCSISVSDNLLQMLEVPLLEGRWATKSEFDNNAGMLLLDKRSQDAIQIHSNDVLDYYRGSVVSGILGNINLRSLRQDPSNNVFIVGDKGTFPTNVYIKLAAGADRKAATELIYKNLRQIDELYPFELQYYDDLIDQLYADETKMNRIISIFGFLAILVSIVGVFGMVVFETQYRRKEIGVRRVMGSSITDILIIFNKKYLVISTICCFLAAPAAYYAVFLWSKNFSSRPPFQLWPFLVAFAIVLVVSIITVTLQSWRAASENPVKSLHAE